MSNFGSRVIIKIDMTLHISDDDNEEVCDEMELCDEEVDTSWEDIDVSYLIDRGLINF